MMESTASPLYLDWDFWNTMLALLALALTQLPLIRSFLSKPELEIDIHERITISHLIGNPSVVTYVSIKNLGHHDVKITKLFLHIRNQKNHLVTLNANLFYESSNNPSSPLVTRQFYPFHLKKDTNWGQTLCFWNYLDRDDEIDYKRAQEELQKELYQPWSSTAPPPPKIAVEDKVVPFKRLFEKNFIWKKGEFFFEFELVTQPEAQYNRKSMRITLYEADIIDLKKITERYCYGESITYPSSASQITVEAILGK
ncbi:hypothetical protein [Rheinheimera soli]|uniref:Uncharacterized protein n=1 Tax=Rheinheimera soli TaxID=443616 RepID=A0ABU1VXX3_9GAMM|nr:hypothetical protein [Rheinheimera soli]MDR7120569.1 hypothetical protein [Rheinheimera soli]